MTTDRQLLASRSGRGWENNTGSYRKGTVKDDENLIHLREDRCL